MAHFRTPFAMVSSLPFFQKSGLSSKTISFNMHADLSIHLSIDIILIISIFRPVLPKRNLHACKGINFVLPYPPNQSWDSSLCFEVLLVLVLDGYFLKNPVSFYFSTLLSNKLSTTLSIHLPIYLPSILRPSNHPSTSVYV